MASCKCLRLNARSLALLQGRLVTVQLTEKAVLSQQEGARNQKMSTLHYDQHLIFLSSHIIIASFLAIEVWGGVRGWGGWHKLVP